MAAQNEAALLFDVDNTLLDNDRTLEHVRAWGETVILSDGDVVFQPRKIERSGLREAVRGRVLNQPIKASGMAE